LSLNSSGVIVGQASTTAEGDIRAVRWVRGRVERLEALGNRWSCATDINDAGQAVGAVRAPGGGAGCLAYRHDRGVVETLGDLGGAYSWAEVINGRGQVVGWAFTAGHEEHAVLWEDGRTEDLGTLGGADSRARDINDFAEVVGVAATADGALHAFLWGGGAMEDLGTLGGEGSDALAINGRGQVVGRADAADGIGHAFLYSAATGMLDLNGCVAVRDVLLLKATGISDSGVIVGWGLRAGRIRAVRLTPLPPEGSRR
jgi:probable HAF family extracellular repeat protein